MADPIRRRGLAGPVGFAHTKRQFEAVVARIEARDGGRIAGALACRNVGPSDRWRLAIAPHDDYAYAGCLYPLALRNVAAPLVVIFGVAHKARALELEDALVFDAFTHWRGPVPAMSFARMDALARKLAQALDEVLRDDGLAWGRDVALLASTDAVHYGDEGWNGRDFAFFGADAAGYAKAIAHEHAILRDCFEGELRPERVERFTRYMLADDDHREYKWTWCGRYSVPFALLTAWHLQRLRAEAPLLGSVLGYATSLDDQRIDVSDREGMGVTAPATLRHWVGYVAVGFR